MLLGFLLAQVATSTTNCTPIGSTVTCNTQTEGAPRSDWMMDLATNKQGRDVQQAQAAASAMSDEGAANRRAAAYSQVGALIAQGKCDEAKRLASFYGHKDIVRDTAKACP